MANDTVSSTPPDLGGLSSPGIQAGGPIPAPNQPMPPAAAMSPEMAPPAVGGPSSPDTGVNPAVPPAPPKGGTPVGTPNPPPHARLLAMVNGLSIGLASFGTSLATHGREGGAPEVEQLRGAQQQQKIAAQQATAAQKNAELQQKLITGQINEGNARNWLLLQTAPDVLAESHLKPIAEQQTLQTAEADFRAAHGGMDAATFNKVLGDANPVSGQSAATGSFFLNGAQRSLRAAQTAQMPADNPAMHTMQRVLANPNATAKELYTATQQLELERESRKAALAEKSAGETAASGSAVGKLSTPEALAAPGAQAAIQAKIDDPTTDPNDLPRLRALIPQAAVAQFNAQNIKEREARNQQIVNQGSPDVAGRMLADKTLTLDELKSRQVTPAFIEAATAAAQKYDPTFQAPVAAAQARAAATPANQQFFGNTDSLLVQGGTLDQLAQAHASLGNGKIPIFNKLENLRKAAAGQGPQAAFAAAELGVADDYSKVISGGAGSDTSRQQALDIINRDLSPEGMSAAIGQIRKTVQSQRNGRIGLNPYLKSMFPDPSTLQETSGQAGTQKAAPGSAASKVHANLTDFTHHFQSAKGMIYSDDGTTWYDANGNLIPGKK